MIFKPIEARIISKMILIFKLFFLSKLVLPHVKVELKKYFRSKIGFRTNQFKSRLDSIPTAWQLNANISQNVLLLIQNWFTL